MHTQAVATIGVSVDTLPQLASVLQPFVLSVFMLGDWVQSDIEWLVLKRWNGLVAIFGVQPLNRAKFVTQCVQLPNNSFAMG